MELGAYDQRILAWPAGWEPATCAVIAGLITRAQQSGKLLPAENIALTVARSQIERGENPPPNTTAMLIMALDRLTGRDDCGGGERR